MEWNKKLILFLEQLGVKHYFGCNGGGVIHFTKHLSNKETSLHSEFFHYSEYNAGFAPIGHYLATQEIACSVSTTGAAQKLAANGASDARFMGVPSIYIMALSSKANYQRYPLQDTSDDGINIVKQFQAEFKDSVIWIKQDSDLNSLFSRIKKILSQNQPVILFYHPEILCEQVHDGFDEKHTLAHQPPITSKALKPMIETLSKPDPHRRVVVFVGSEAAIDGVCPKVFQRFVEKIHAQVIYSVNGDNTAILTEKRNLGHIMLGGNLAAVDAWQTLKKNDVLICLGIDVWEYVLNLKKVPECQSVCFTHHTNAYGQINGQYQHVFHQNHLQINGRIQSSLEQFLTSTTAITFPKNMQFLNKEDVLSHFQPQRNKVNLIDFYKRIDQLWQKQSIAFEDVCIAYRDRQAILKQPNHKVKFFTANHGSAMGCSFGLGVGAAIADPQQKVFIFTGDGCFQLFGGSLNQAAKLNMTLFILNNGQLSLIRDGCKTILQKSTEKTDHADLAKIEWDSLAKAFGWRYFRVQPDLSNLADIMQASYDSNPTSILVDIPIDPGQVVGINYRYANITKDSHL
ncbi:MAG: hypothetical protein CMF42_01830 [Legionellales bacterium]|nr:hypothetical protein [Legionellales bacterium]|tara:strand:- start:2016 stop:3728 length:1713 start_codon:yes stop_codon:yes gene_type:complete